MCTRECTEIPNLKGKLLSFRDTVHYQTLGTQRLQAMIQRRPSTLENRQNSKTPERSPVLEAATIVRAEDGARLRLRQGLSSTKYTPAIPWHDQRATFHARREHSPGKSNLHSPAIAPLNANAPPPSPKPTSKASSPEMGALPSAPKNAPAWRTETTFEVTSSDFFLFVDMSGFRRPKCDSK